MSRVQVGMIAYRAPNGDFLPDGKPIYRDIPDLIVEMYDTFPLDRLAELFADKYQESLLAQYSTKK